VLKGFFSNGAGADWREVDQTHDLGKSAGGFLLTHNEYIYRTKPAANHALRRGQRRLSPVVPAQGAAWPSLKY